MSETQVRERTNCCKQLMPTNFKQNFKEQTLPAWQPLYKSGSVALSFFIIALFFLIFGIVIIVEDNTVVEVIRDYTDCNDCNDFDFARNDSGCIACNCTISIEVEEDIPKPVYVQYKLEGFYQNHRRYVISRDDLQLRGDWDKSPAGNCDPYGTDENGVKIVPCGAIANSVFNDSFELSDSGDSVVPMLRTGIAWSSDKDNKFKNPSDWQSLVQDGNLLQSGYASPPNWCGRTLLDLDVDDPDNNGLKNEDLIVWMRTASFPTFRKPWRRIDHDQPGFENGLPKGTYNLTIAYNYPISQFGAKKYFIITNSSAFGTLNQFLGIAYILVGCISFIIALVFLVLKLKGGTAAQRRGMSGQRD